MVGLLCSSFHLTPSLWSDVFGSILARARSWRDEDLFTLFANRPRPELREFCDARLFNVSDTGSIDDSLRIKMIYYQFNVSENWVAEIEKGELAVDEKLSRSEVFP